MTKKIKRQMVDIIRGGSYILEFGMIGPQLFFLIILIKTMFETLEPLIGTCLVIVILTCYMFKSPQRIVIESYEVTK